jgi:acyl dehydratase
VADFVEVTGDDPERWVDAAPPGFIAAALFEVAPDLLALLYDHSVIHGEQSFAWERPLPLGADLTVVGEVTRARERGGVYFITFDIDVSDDADTIATGSARFLAAGESAPTQAGEELVEPEVNDRGSPKDGQVSASRADLVRYAAATRDWNPVHWDHQAAVHAGLSGVVAHGLLQAAWALRTATAPTIGDAPLVGARVRFKSPLPPATPVDVDARWGDTRVDLTLSAGDREYVTASIELADG